MTLDKTTLLKIDKDCVVSRKWLDHYVHLVIIPVCRGFGVRVIWVKICSSQRKGFHVYIRIDPPVDAWLALELHFHLGDDCQRCSFNKARVESGLAEWSKLFERPNVRLHTIYRASQLRPQHSNQQAEVRSYA
jgi:hypothetical protein